MRLLLSMGVRNMRLPGAPLRPRLRRLDTTTGVVEDVLAPDVSPALHPGPREHAELTGAHRVGDVLVQTTRTEVLWIDLRTFTVVDRFSHPWLTDVHDALPLADGGLAVTSTGLDAVLVFDAARHLVAHHPLGRRDRTVGLSPDTDLRTLPFDAHKPHDAHPNHLFQHDGQLYATCLALQCAVCVLDRARDLLLPEGPPHDGRWIDGLLWFTTVDGQVLAIDPTSRARVHHLRVVEPETGIAGWCRGVEVVGDRVFVGMTTLRASRWRELARRVARGDEGKKRPTRVVELSRRTGEVVASWTLGDDGTVYAVHAIG